MVLECRKVSANFNLGHSAIFQRRKRNKHTHNLFSNKSVNFDGDFSSWRQTMTAKSPNIDSGLLKLSLRSDLQGSECEYLLESSGNTDNIKRLGAMRTSR